MCGASDDPSLPRIFRRTDSSQFRTPRHNRAPRPKDTPVALTVNGSKNAFDSRDSHSRYRRYANEAKKWIVGPMPVEEFLASFLPPGDNDGLEMPDPTNAFKKVRVNAVKDEREMYGPLLDDINDSGRCPSIKFVDTSTLPLDSGLGAFKPDSCGYSEDELGAVIREDGKIPADLGHAELFFELKAKNDPFVDPAPNLRDKTKLQEHNFIVIGDKGDLLKAKKTLGQNVAYAAEACARQHRAFYFSVLIVGTQARFIRWDRAGAIVTRAFNYINKPRYLCEFLWRFGLATPEQRGYDPSVTVATDIEEKVFRDTIAAHVAFQLAIDTKENAKRFEEEVNRHYEPSRVTKMDVYNEVQHTLEQYLVSRPVKSPISMAGRSTRGYWGVKIDSEGHEGEIAFVKDTWRINVADMEMEGAIYGDMNDNNVVNISDLFCHGDLPDDIDGLLEKLETGKAQCKVPNGQSEPKLAPSDTRHGGEAPEPAVQSTRSDEFIGASWSCKGERIMSVTKHTHYRLILKEVGYPLSDFTGTRELFDATGDAFKALVDAKEKCKRLHRDISLDNIILVRDKKTGRRRGILIDWELSTKIDRNGMARDYFRSGTWAFMSVAALKGGPNFRHTVADDMESMLYVVLYCCARWLPHDPVARLGQQIAEFFDSYIDLGPRMRGGRAKGSQMFDRYFTDEFVFHDKSVEEWILTAYEYLAPSMDTDKKKNWDTTALDELWDNVRTRDLADGDRFAHDVGDAFRDPSVYYGTRTTTITSTRPSASRSIKRTADEDLEEVVQNSKRLRGNDEESRVTDEGKTGQGQDSKERVSRKNSSRKQRTRQNAPATNEEPSGTADERSGSRHTKSGGRGSRRNSPGKQGQRQSARLAAKASSSSIKRGS